MSEIEWPARRIHNAVDLPRDEYADTFSDGRELEAAHGCYEQPDDATQRDDSKAAVRFLAACAAFIVAALLAVWLLAGSL